MHLENVDQKTIFYNSDETENRFPFTYFSQHFRIYLAVFALKYFIHGHW